MRGTGQENEREGRSIPDGSGLIWMKKRGMEQG
jgi:hypothetical protein